MNTPLHSHASRPTLTNMRGIYRHHGDGQFYMCFYALALSFIAPYGDHWWRTSWLLKGYEGLPMEINLESWEVGQLMGGN